MTNTLFKDVHYTLRGLLLANGRTDVPVQAHEFRVGGTRTVSCADAVRVLRSVTEAP